MEIDEDEASINATPSVTEPSHNLTSTTTNLPLLQQTIQKPPPLIPPAVAPIVPAVSPIAPSPIVPLIAPLPIVPPIAPIPSIPPVIRPLAPIPPRPLITRPPPPQTTEQNASDLDSDNEEYGANKSMDYEISEESKQVRERQEKAMQDLLLKRRAYALAVPTNDSAVRARLRRLGEPVTLFGEREMERRDRLRMIMVKLDAEGQLDKLLKAHEDEEAANAATPVEDSDGEGPQQYPFYTEGSKELLQARIDIAKYSVVKAALRLERAKRRRDDPDEDFDAEIDWALKQAGNLELYCSEIGDDRPLTGCSFSRDGTMLATWYFSVFLLK